jgi:hypothetical protein
MVPLLEQIEAAVRLSRQMLVEGQRAVAIQQLVNIQNLISQLVCIINLEENPYGRGEPADVR